MISSNLPNWERLARLVVALAMLGCGLVTYPTVAGVTFLVLGATTLATALVGFCPACALAGRRGRSGAGP